MGHGRDFIGCRRVLENRRRLFIWLWLQGFSHRIVFMIALQVVIRQNLVK